MDKAGIEKLYCYKSSKNSYPDDFNCVYVDSTDSYPLYNRELEDSETDRFKLFYLGDFSKEDFFIRVKSFLF